MVMKIRYSKHALDRLRQRGISKKETREAVLYGQKREWQSVGETIRCTYKKKNKQLVVIYKQQKEIHTVITTYYLN